jgi:hypothetical protein
MIVAGLLLPANALRPHSPTSQCVATMQAKWSHGWLSIPLYTSCNDEVLVLTILDMGVQIPLLGEL